MESSFEDGAGMKNDQEYRGYYHRETRPFVSYSNSTDHYRPLDSNNVFHHSYYNNFPIYYHGHHENIHQLRSIHNQTQGMRQARPTNSFHNSMHLMQAGTRGSPVQHYVDNFHFYNESQRVLGHPSNYLHLQPPPFPPVRDARNPSFHHHRQYPPREPLPSLVLPDLNHDVNQISPTISPTTENSILPNRASYKGRFSPGRLGTKSQPPSSPITTLREIDIVCGRGAPTLFHEGNKKFRELILQYQSTYLFSKRPDKPRVAWKLLEIVTSNGGRFVRRVKANHTSVDATAQSSCHCWEQLNERQAYDKICQSLREGAPELRRKILRSHDSKQNSKPSNLQRLGKKKHNP